MKVFGKYVFPTDAKKITNRRDNSFMNVGATISPDGSYIAFISDRKGRMGVWVLNLANRKLRMLQEGERSPDFENLHVLKPSLSISRDNLLAVISQGTYSDIVSVYDLRRFKRVKRFELRVLMGRTVERSRRMAKGLPLWGTKTEYPTFSSLISKVVR